MAIRYCDATLLRRLPSLSVPSNLHDHNGHVNIRHFVGFFSDIGVPYFDSLELDDNYRSERNAGIFDVEHRLKYFAEISSGDELDFFGTLLGRTNKAIHGLWLMFDARTQGLASSLEFVTIHTDLMARRSRPIDAELAERLDREIEHRRDAAELVAPMLGLSLRSAGGEQA